MTELELVIACVTVLLLPLVIGFVLIALRSGESERSDDTPVPVGPITIHTRLPDDQTIHGLVYLETADRYVLTAAEYVTAAGNQPIPDHVTVFKAHVAWVQEHELVFDGRRS